MQQNTPEWLEFRRTKIGSSDAPIILGTSPYKTPYRLWQEKLGAVKQLDMSLAQKRGHDLEDKARKRFMELTGLDVKPAVLQHPDYPWMIASVDGISLDGRILLEIKCPGKEDHKLAQQGLIPEKYKAQLQHQLEVCNLPYSYYFSFDGEDGIIIKVKRNKTYIKKLIKAEEEFLECLISLIPPPMTNRDYQSKEDDPIWLEKASTWIQVNKKIKELEILEKSLKEDLIGLSQEKSCFGGGVKLRQIVQKGRIDYSKIEVLKEVALDEYRDPPTICWRIMQA